MFTCGMCNVTKHPSKLISSLIGLLKLILPKILQLFIYVYIFFVNCISYLDLNTFKSICQFCFVTLSFNSFRISKWLTIMSYYLPLYQRCLSQKYLEVRAEKIHFKKSLMISKEMTQQYH